MERSTWIRRRWQVLRAVHAQGQEDRAQGESVESLGVRRQRQRSYRDNQGLLARTVPRLVEFARAENKSKVEARRARELESQLQRQKDADEAAAIARSEAGSASVDNEFVRVVPSGSLVQPGSARRTGTAKAQLDFLSGFSTKLDRSLQASQPVDVANVAWSTNPALKLICVLGCRSNTHPV